MCAAFVIRYLKPARRLWKRSARTSGRRKNKRDACNKPKCHTSGISRSGRETSSRSSLGTSSVGSEYVVSTAAGASRYLAPLVARFHFNCGQFVETHRAPCRIFNSDSAPGRARTLGGGRGFVCVYFSRLPPPRNPARDGPISGPANAIARASLSPSPRVCARVLVRRERVGVVG